jgi:hypothetical protein
MNLEITTDGRIILTSSPKKGIAFLKLADGQSIKIVDDGQTLKAYPTRDAILKPDCPERQKNDISNSN